MLGDMVLAESVELPSRISRWIVFASKRAIASGRRPSIEMMTTLRLAESPAWPVGAVVPLRCAGSFTAPLSNAAGDAWAVEGVTDTSVARVTVTNAAKDAARRRSETREAKFPP